METFWVIRVRRFLMIVVLLAAFPASAQFVDLGNIATSGGEVVARADKANKIEFGTAAGGQPYVRLTFPPPKGAVVSQDSKAIASIQQMITSSAATWFPVAVTGGGAAYVRIASILRMVFPPCASPPCAASVEPYQGLIETVQAGDVANLKSLTSDTANWLALSDKQTYLHLSDMRAVAFSCARSVCTKATADFSMTTSAVFSDANEISQLEKAVNYTPTVAIKKHQSPVFARSSAVRKPASRHD